MRKFFASYLEAGGHLASSTLSSGNAFRGICSVINWHIVRLAFIPDNLSSLIRLMNLEKGLSSCRLLVEGA